MGAQPGDSRLHTVGRGANGRDARRVRRHLPAQQGAAQLQALLLQSEIEVALIH
jgi:hypothetical protein